MKFTLENIKELRAEYNKALKTQTIEFEFKGHTLLIGYAKYLLEYLEKQI
jgi:hypothetical protein